MENIIILAVFDRPLGSLLWISTKVIAKMVNDGLINTVLNCHCSLALCTNIHVYVDTQLLDSVHISSHI